MDDIHAKAARRDMARSDQPAVKRESAHLGLSDIAGSQTSEFGHYQTTEGVPATILERLLRFASGPSDLEQMKASGQAVGSIKSLSPRQACQCLPIYRTIVNRLLHRNDATLRRLLPAQ